jgi:hypothetical protein
MISFTPFSESKFMFSSVSYKEDLLKLDFTIDKQLPTISTKSIQEFLSKNYNDLCTHNSKPIVPYASCSILSTHKGLKQRLERYFNMEVFTVYGYLEFNKKSFHKFTKQDIREVVNADKYIPNHHAWLMFKNGQILDLTFITTLYVAREVYTDEEEFILTQSKNTKIPLAMNQISKITKKSQFRYKPMFVGNLFSDKLLCKNRIEFNFPND